MLSSGIELILVRLRSRWPSSNYAIPKPLKPKSSCKPCTLRCGKDCNISVKIHLWNARRTSRRLLAGSEPSVESFGRPIHSPPRAARPSSGWSTSEFLPPGRRLPPHSSPASTTRTGPETATLLAHRFPPPSYHLAMAKTVPTTPQRQIPSPSNSSCVLRFRVPWVLKKKLSHTPRRMGMVRAISNRVRSLIFAAQTDLQSDFKNMK